MTKNSNPDQHSEDEQFLVRLFRLMDYWDQNELLVKLVDDLVKAKKDPEIENLNDLVEQCMPFEYEGEYFIVLDNMGDYPAVVENVMDGEMTRYVVGIEYSTPTIAEFLTEEYIRICKEQGYDLPTDRMEAPYTEDDMIKDLTNEFNAFLNAWREAVISKIEAMYKPKSSDTNAKQQ